MAFHPLRSFRRHQKTWLAGLTILSMLSFVVLGSLQGVGRYFERIFGSSNAKTAVKLYGKAIDTNTLQILRMRREAANSYVNAVVDQARNTAFLRVMQSSKDWDDPRAAQAVMGLLQSNGMSQQLPYYGIALNPNMPRDFRLESLGKAYSEVSALQGVAASTNKSKEAEDLAAFAQSMLSTYLSIQRDRNEMYFGGKLDTQGLADFILLRDQADRLGISLDDDSVNELMREETFNQFSSDDLRLMASRFQQRYERVLQPEDWESALRDEFRVRLAKEALLGYDPDHPTPGYDMSAMLTGHQALTPYSLWHRYEDVRGESQIGLLPIKVDSKKYLDKVPPPKQSELVGFFEKYKNQPENPESAQAGFMTPAQYAFEWIGARPDAPYFKQKAEAQLPSKLAVLVSTGNQILTPALADQDLASWLSKVQLLNDSRGVDGSIRAAVAALATDTVSSAAPIAGAAMLETSLYSARMDQATLPAFDATMVALAATPRCGVVPAAAWLEYTDINKRFLPEDVAMAGAYREQRQTIANNLVQQALDDIRQELETRAQLAKASDGGDFERLYQPKAGRVPAVVDLLLAELAACSPVGPGAAADLAAPASRQLTETLQARGQLATRMLAAANNPFALVNVAAQELSPPVRLMQEPIASAIRKYGLDHGAMTQPLDRSKLAGAPALAQLKSALMSSELEGGSAADENTKFPNRLVGPPGGQVSTQVYSFPQSTSAPDGEQFLYWPTAVVDRRVPSYAEVRDRVKTRWLLEQARKEAQKDAERIAKEIEEHKSSSGNVVDMVKQVTGQAPAITLDRVALLSRPEFPSPMSSRSGPYQRYQVPVTSGLKPGGDFVTKLLDMRQPGDATVVHDASEMTYYVAVLENRQLPSDTAFFRDYASPEAYGQVVSVADSGAASKHSQLAALLETLRDRANLQITPEGKDAFKAGRQ